jgi:hypothetical protein
MLSEIIPTVKEIIWQSQKIASDCLEQYEAKGRLHLLAGYFIAGLQGSAFDTIVAAFALSPHGRVITRKH